MNELIMLKNSEKRKIIEDFKRDQEEMDKFYHEVIQNIKSALRDKEKEKPKE